jgi:hypothetical protein
MEQTECERLLRNVDCYEPNRDYYCYGTQSGSEEQNGDTVCTSTFTVHIQGSNSSFHPPLVAFLGGASSVSISNQDANIPSQTNDED